MPDLPRLDQCVIIDTDRNQLDYKTYWLNLCLSTATSSGILVLFIISWINVDLVIFLPSDLIMNKRIDKVPTLKYMFTCIW